MREERQIILEERVLEFLAKASVKARLRGDLFSGWFHSGIAEQIGLSRSEGYQKILSVLRKLEREGRVFGVRDSEGRIRSWSITTGEMIMRGYRPGRDFNPIQGEPITKPQLYTNAVLDLLYNDRLKDGRGLARGIIVERLNWSTTSVAGVLEKEIKKGNVYVTGIRKGSPGKHYLYSVTLTYLKKRHLFEEYFRLK